MMDNASIHGRRIPETRIPVDGYRKSDMQAWCDARGIAHDGLSFKELQTKLRMIRKTRKFEYELTFVDRIAADHGIKVLKTPPYHSWLSPIESVWSIVKHDARKLNMANAKMTQDSMLRIIEGVFSNVGVEKVRKFILLAEREEEEYRRSDSNAKDYADFVFIDCDVDCEYSSDAELSDIVTSLGAMRVT